MYLRSEMTFFQFICKSNVNNANSHNKTLHQTRKVVPQRLLRK